MSNTVMVILSLLCLFIVGGIIVNLFKHQYEPKQTINGFTNVNVSEIEKLIDENSNKNINWKILGEQLSNYGYKIYITNNNENIYSNLINLPKNASIYAHKLNLTKDMQIFVSGETIVIGKKIIKQNKEYKVYALYNPYEEIQWFGKSRNRYEVLLISFIVISICSILVIVLLSFLFTKKLVKRISNPINKLIDSAQRIENGDLSTFIEYKGDLEFEMLCNTFNEMQTHLKEEKEKNIVYEKARTDMLAGLSHDLRTPLTSIKGYIKGIKDGIANTPEKREAYLSTAYNKACDMETLLQKLFFFSKLETGNLPFLFNEVNLPNFIERFVNQSRLDLKLNNATIDFYKKDETMVVNVDTEHMQRVFINIIENSLKYSKSNNLKIIVDLTKKDDKAIISFKDNGVGISEEKLENVFNQFYRGDESRSTKNGEGSGIGLYIVKYIIQSHGGLVEAKNEDGFKIIITLPLKERIKND